MTYRAIGNALLRSIGILSLADAANSNGIITRGLEDQDIIDVVDCLNGSLEELFALIPSTVIERQVGGVLRAPTSITLSLTQYSTTCVVTGWASWMAGCTVRISGDDLDNRFISSTELLRPYTSTTGSGKAATVYADAIPVPVAYNTVIAPVRLPSGSPLPLATGREHFDGWITRNQQPSDSSVNDTIFNKTIGRPVICLGDFEALGTAQPQLYLRFNPMPDQVYAVTYTGKLAPPTVTAANIWSEASPDTDPGISSYVPNAASALRAIAMQRWTAHPSFSPQGQTLTEIARQYEGALKIMRQRKALIGPRMARYAE